MHLWSKSVSVRVENEFSHSAVDAPNVKACLKGIRGPIGCVVIWEDVL